MASVGDTGTCPNSCRTSACSARCAAWRVKYARVEGKDGRDYTVDHTSTIFLVDPSGAILARLPHDLDGPALANRIRSVILKR